jgi:hypothetical protein
MKILASQGLAIAIALSILAILSKPEINHYFNEMSQVHMYLAGSSISEKPEFVDKIILILL